MNEVELREWFDTVSFDYACAIIHSSDFYGTRIFPFDGNTQEEAHLKAADYVIERLNPGNMSNSMSSQEKIDMMRKLINILPEWDFVDISNEPEDKEIH